MRILYVTNDIPFPPDNGVRIVSHNAMRLMSESGHELSLVTLTQDVVNAERYFPNVAGMCRNGSAWYMTLGKRQRSALFVRSLIQANPVFVERFRSAEFRQRLQRTLEEFRPDVIHYDLIPMLQYHDMTPSGVGAVASINDSWALALENGLSAGRYSGAEKIYRHWEFNLVSQYERQHYPLFDVVHVMSDADRAYLESRSQVRNVMVIPNGVHEALFDSSARNIGKTRIVFVGQLEGDNLHYLLKFLDSAWPQVLRACGSAQLTVVGKMGVEARTQLAGKYFHNVEFQGYVDRLESVYQESGIAVIPIDKNCGILNKAMEAMAGGLACVGFTKAFSGISAAQRNVHFAAAETMAGIGDALVELLTNQTKLRSIQSASRTLAATSFTWESRRTDYVAMYEIARKRAEIRKMAAEGLS